MEEKKPEKYNYFLARNALRKLEKFNETSGRPEDANIENMQLKIVTKDGLKLVPAKQWRHD
ncbi:MAG: hypothetical protein V1721_04005 [Pseudomonadota bacterium]